MTGLFITGTLFENASTKDYLRSDNEIQPFISADEHNVDLHVQEALLQQQLLGHQLTKFCSLTLSAMVKKGQALMIMETTWWMELFTLVVIF